MSNSSRYLGARFTTIIGLLFCSSPPAIIRRIRTIIIRETVQRVPWAWSFAHILEKIRKTLLPAQANSYTSVSIIFSILGPWVQAPIFHALPYMIFGRLAHPMSSVSGRGSFALKTSAGKYFFPQVVLSNYRHIVAIASAFPEPVTAISRRFGNNYKPPKPHTSGYISHVKNDNLWGII